MGKKLTAPWGCQQQTDPCCRSAASMTSASEELMKPTLLLHSCCGPCSTAVIERLAPDYEITVFFYNPCITDTDEYEKRKASQIKFIDQFNQSTASRHKLFFVEGEYEPEAYEELITGYENEPEGGQRCEICFRMRLEKTAKHGLMGGYGIFSTTLTVSPHKNYERISGIGKEFEKKYGIEFLDLDFKKKAGFQRSIQLTKENGLYRQNYCGCQYSMRATIDTDDTE